MLKNFYRIDTPSKSQFKYPKSPAGTSFALLENKGLISNWHPLTLSMDCLYFPDHTSCLFSQHIFSQRIKAILEHYHPKNSIQWLPVFLKNSEDEIREYYIPHFLVKEDILDKIKTEYDEKGDVFNPVYLYDKIKSKGFYFNTYGRLTFSEEIKKKIQKIGGTNFVFIKERSISDFDEEKRKLG